MQLDGLDTLDKLSRVSDSARQLFSLICAHFAVSGHNEISIDEASQDVVCVVCGIVLREGKVN